MNRYNEQVKIPPSFEDCEWDESIENDLKRAIELFKKWDGSIHGLHKIVTENSELYSLDFLAESARLFQGIWSNRRFENDFCVKGNIDLDAGHEFFRIIKVYHYIISSIQIKMVESGDPEGKIVISAMKTYLKDSSISKIQGDEDAYFQMFKEWDSEIPGAVNLVKELIIK